MITGRSMVLLVAAVCTTAAACGDDDDAASADSTVVETTAAPSSVAAPTTSIVSTTMATSTEAPPTTELAPTTPPTEEQLTPEISEIKLALFRSAGNAAAYAAIDEGYFEKYGLTVTPEFIESSAAGVSNLVANDVQATYSSYFSIIDSNINGIPLDIMSEAQESVPDFNQAVVLADSDVQGIADFVGKSVAVPSINSSVDSKLMYEMKQEGLDYEGVNFVELPYGEMPAALESGTVDVAIISGQSLVLAKDNLDLRVVWDVGGGMWEGFAEAGWITRDDFSSDNPNTVLAFQCAIQEGADIVRNDREVYERVTAAYVEITPEDLANIPALGFVGGLRPEKIQQNADILFELGRITDPFDVTTILAPAPEGCEQLIAA